MTFTALFSRIHMQVRCLVVIFIAIYVVIGPDRNVEAAAKFIQDKFQAQNSNNDRPIHSHFITATDTDNIKVVVKLSYETILRENLQAASLLKMKVVLNLISIDLVVLKCK